MEKKERAFNHECALNHAKSNPGIFSNKAKVNTWTCIVLVLMSIVLYSGASYDFSDPSTGALRDIVEATLEVLEKMLYVWSVNAQGTRHVQVTLLVLAGYSITKQALLIHFDTVEYRIAGANWAFFSALVAKALEHTAYAVRLTPSTKAWDFWLEAPNHNSHYLRRQQKILSGVQLARRHLWADNIYEEFLFAQKIEGRTKWKFLNDTRMPLDSNV